AARAARDRAAGGPTRGRRSVFPGRPRIGSAISVRGKRSAPFSLRSQRRQFDARTVAFPAPDWESRQNTKPLGVYAMSKFLIEASLTTVGAKGVQSEGGTARREAVTKAVESVGGRLDSFFFGFGDRDVYVI